MYLLMNDLYQELNKFSQILIYGAGNYAALVYPLLKRAGLKTKIASFVVTDAPTKSDIDGIPIRNVRYIDSFNREKSVILAAVSEEYANEIIGIVREQKFMHIVKMADYFLTERKLRKISDEQFINCIVEQYSWHTAETIMDIKEKQKQFKGDILQREKKVVDRKTIVFISSNLQQRTVKIIEALIKRQYKIIILEYGYFNILTREELPPNNIKIFQCQDILELFYMAMHYKPLVYYYDPRWGDRINPEIMIRHKNIFGKIVISLYDVLNDGYVQAEEEQKEAERYLLENADGIIWRWFSKDFLEEKKGFIFKGKSIQFLDYCKGYNIQNREQRQDEVRLCLVLGNTYGLLDETIYVNDGRYVEYARIDTIMEVIGEREDCIFHVFMGGCSVEDQEKFAALERKYANFKIFYGTKHGELIQKISRYDYGCFLYTDGRDVPELETKDNIFYGSTHNNAMSNKYFDYLDAGLPIIATRPQKLCDYLNEFGVIVKMCISDMDIDYLKENRDFYRENVKNASRNLLMDNQIQRLTDFFEALYDIAI